MVNGTVKGPRGSADQKMPKVRKNRRKRTSKPHCWTSRQRDMLSSANPGTTRTKNINPRKQKYPRRHRKRCAVQKRKAIAVPDKVGKNGAGKAKELDKLSKTSDTKPGSKTSHDRSVPPRRMGREAPTMYALLGPRGRHRIPASSLFHLHSL